MFSTAIGRDAKCDYQFLMTLLHFSTGPGANDDNFKHFKIYHHFLKSPTLGNKSVTKQAVAPSMNTEVLFYCENSHSIAEVDGRRYCSPGENRARSCGIAYSIYSLIFFLYIAPFSQATSGVPRAGFKLYRGGFQTPPPEIPKF
jgi:hypothetical protein